MTLFRLIVVSLTLAACGGESPDPTPADSQQQQDSSSGATCTNADYDPCTDNAQCTSGNCHFFQQSAFTVCVPACTQGGTPCPNDSTGAAGTCNGMGICKPAAANDCTR